MNLEVVSIDAPAGAILGTIGAGARRFLGIPYADAPVGDLRFAGPVRRGRFASPFAGFQHGATPQRVPLFDQTTIPEPTIPGDDTLTIDVVAPRGAAGAPVLFWIHGGGFIAGSPASPWYDGVSFARDGVVVVTASYRLGIDGFGTVPGSPANRGLRDLTMALEWVQDNISAFGGDPARVTIAGQSAGGGAVLALMCSPLAVGLFSAAVSVSGVDVTQSAAESRAATERIAAELGVEPSARGFGPRDDGSTMRAIRKLLDGGAFPTPTPLGPVHGDTFLPLPIAEALHTFSRDIPLLIGATADEFDGGPTPESPHRPDPNDPTVLAAREAGERVTDTLFRAVCVRAAEARRDAPASTWTYSFDWPSPITRGATHCIDVPFLFDILQTEGVDAAVGSGAPQGIATAMHGDFVNFLSGRPMPWVPALGVRGEVSRIYAATGVGEAAGAFDACLHHVGPRGGKDG